MLSRIILFAMNAAVIAILIAYGFFLKTGHLEFGIGVFCGMVLFASWFRVRHGYWP
jgi:hypothetical protein